MISERAIEVLEELARTVGFGRREDYPFVGASPVSAGDWKGDSIAVCVFADREHAEAFQAGCLRELVGSWTGTACDLETRILNTEGADGMEFYIAVVTAVDLSAKSDPEWEE